jgi:tetratricopeptide (TPR) repeat protein
MSIHHFYSSCFVALFTAWMICGFAAGHGTHDERVKIFTEKLKLDPADILSRHELALALAEGGDWELALTELDTADKLQKPGSQLDSGVTRARALVIGGKFDEARTVLDAFMKKSPANSQALLERSRVFDALKMPVESLADFRKAMAYLGSPDPNLYLEFADKLVRQNQQDEAARIIQKAIAEKGEISSLILKALDLETATSQWDAALTRIDFLQHAAPRPEPWIGKRAVLLTKAGRDPESRAAWAELLERIGALPNLERGTPAMLQLAEDAQRALAGPAGDKKGPDGLTPAQRDSSALRFPLRRTFADGNNHEEELESLDRAIEQVPANAELWFTRAYLLVLDRKFNDARADCNEADRLAPDQFATDRVRGQILTAEGRLDDAKSLLDRFLQSHPTDGLALAARARLLLKMNHYESALADFRAALLRIPTADSNLYQEVATTMAAHENLQEAVQVLAAGLVKFPRLPSMMQQALELEIATGNYEAALVRIGELEKSAPLPEPWMARRALVLAQAGRKNESREAWMALRDRISAMPNLQRGAPHFQTFSQQAEQSLAP